MIRIHGTAIALGEEGVLLRGPSGSGKSDLALRLIEGGARLVADDQTELRLGAGAVQLSAPAGIAGQMEIRGLGIVRMPHRPAAPLRLVVDLVPPESVERLPEPRFCQYLGRDVPRLLLAPFEASAPAKLRAALRMVAAIAADVGNR